jgi:hypothetical protein
MSNPTQLWIPSRLESINSKLELRQCWNAWIRMGQLPDIGDHVLVSCGVHGLRIHRYPCRTGTQ